MKRVGKSWILSTAILLSATLGKAQTSATASVSVNIIHPVSISIDEDTYKQVINYNRQPGKNTTYDLTVAKFSVAAQAADFYNISMPDAFELENAGDGSCITALVNQTALQIPQWLSNERKIFIVGSELKLPVGHVNTQYRAAPIEVTVNFN